MEKFVHAGDVDLCYSTAGSGPAVLCIQGVGVCGQGWSPQVAALSARFRLISFDNRGIGRSARGTGSLTVERMAADALAVADAERAERFHILGHSMGGLIALQLALSARRRVKSLSLVCTFANGADATRLSLRMLVLGLRSRIGTRAMRRAAMVSMVMPRAYTRSRGRADLARELGALFGRDLADQPPIVGEQLRVMSAYSAIDRLGELGGVPTLVVSAAQDPIAPPRLGRALASAIGGARYVEFADASHALPIQSARELNALLIDHITAAEEQGR